jgi:hypothetical protein
MRKHPMSHILIDSIPAQVRDLCARFMMHRVLLREAGSKRISAIELLRLMWKPRGLIMKLRFHCVNSVDGQCRLKIMLGWYRFVCGNGLVVGTSRLNQRFVHNEYLKLPDLTGVFAEGLEAAKKERASLTEWMGRRIEESRLDKWSDALLRDEWVPLAAARVHYICMTGCDGHFQGRARRRQLIEKE